MKNEYLYRYFYQWLTSMKNAHLCQNKDEICFCDEYYHAHITFYSHLQIMELSIEEKATQDNVFYLHFEMNDFYTTRKNIMAFFQFLREDHQNKQENSKIHFSTLKILVCCTSGLTSHYFAELIKNKQHSIQVDAYPVHQIETVGEDYDVILLAPQIAYMYSQLKKKFGKKVMQIEVIDFATGNVNHVINSLATI